MTSPLAGMVVTLDPSWPASLVAGAILDAARRAYRDVLDIDEMQALMNEIWFNLHDELTEEELTRIGKIIHISIPMNDLNASVSMPPSRQGYFVMFDAVLDLRLTEIFTAPRNIAAWASSYVRAAWGNTFDVAHWVGPSLERLKGIRTGPLPDSFSLGAARDFIFAHECGHFFLNHLDRGFNRKMSFGNHDLSIFDPAERDELDADRFARDLLCRREGRPLPLQKMGVDWLFGFLSGVMAMRHCADALLNGQPAVTSGSSAIERRRAEAWNDYDRRCAEAANDEARAPENSAAVQRVRESVNSFNNTVPIALAHVYAVAPEELMAWAQAVRSPMDEKDFQAYHEELLRLGSKADALPMPPASWRQRLRKWVNRVF